MSIFEERNAVFTLLVVIIQGHASRAEDAHPSFLKWASSVHRWADGQLHQVMIRKTHRSIHRTSAQPCSWKFFAIVGFLLEIDLPGDGAGL